MKKTLLCVSLLTFATSFGQNCSEVFMSEYVEGTGYDKAIELYNPTASAIDLSTYRIERFSNGASINGVLNLTGTIAPYSTFVITNNNTVATGGATSPALVAMADLLDNPYPAPTYMNGNDAILLYNGTTMIDIIGKSGDAAMVTSSGWGDQFPYDGSVGAIWTENHTLIRKATVQTGVTVNPATFIVNVEWDSLSVNTFSNLGQHVCDCYLGLNETAKEVYFNIYPNPTSTGLTNVVADAMIETVSVIDLLGKVVLESRVNGVAKSQELNTADLNKGMYVVKISFANGTTAQSNLIVR